MSLCCSLSMPNSIPVMFTSCLLTSSCSKYRSFDFGCQMAHPLFHKLRKYRCQNQKPSVICIQNSQQVFNRRCQNISLGFFLFLPISTLLQGGQGLLQQFHHLRGSLGGLSKQGHCPSFAYPTNRLVEHSLKEQKNRFKFQV